MRVSKTIRDYVTRTVNEAYSARIGELLEEEKRDVNEQEKILRDRFEQIKAAALADAEKAVTAMPKGFTLRYPTRIDFGTPYVENRALAKKINFWDEHRRNKIEEILVRMELGGTKAELDEILKELGVVEGE